MVGPKESGYDELGRPISPFSYPLSTSSLRVILIRHAESTNNALFQSLQRRTLDHEGDETSSSDFRSLGAFFESNREIDPGLSPRGKIQAELLGSRFRQIYLEQSFFGKHSLSSSSSSSSTTSRGKEDDSGSKNTGSSSLSSSLASSASSTREDLCETGGESSPSFSCRSSRKRETPTNHSKHRHHHGERMDRERGERREHEEEQEEQAHHNCLPPVKGVRVVVSPLLRSIQTGLPIIKALHLERSECMIEPELYEVGGLYKEIPVEMREEGIDSVERFGPKYQSFAGSTKKDFEEKFPGVFSIPDTLQNGWYGTERGREEYSHARERVSRLAEMIWSWVQQSEIFGLHTLIMVGHGHHLDLLLKALLFSHRGEQLLRSRTFVKAPSPSSPAFDFLPPSATLAERPEEGEKEARESSGDNREDSRSSGGTFSASSSSSAGGSLFSTVFSAGVRSYLHMSGPSHPNTNASIGTSSSSSHLHQHHPLKEKKICASCTPPSSFAASYETDLDFLLNNTGVVSLHLTVDRAFVRGRVASGTSQLRSLFSPTTSLGSSSSSSSPSHSFVEYIREKRSAAVECMNRLDHLDGPHMISK